MEHRREGAARGIYDAQHLGSCGLARQRLVALGRRLTQVPFRFVQVGSALGKLTSQIGYELLGTG
jgi:hypothetical protein